jgi:hypothetical protein
VVGGLAFSQLITLYVTPVVYTYMDAASHGIGAWLARLGPKVRHEEPVAVPTGVMSVEGRQVAVKSSGDAAD